MKVAIAGATGVLGEAAIPLLAEAGHDVRGLARRVPEGDPRFASVDVLDREALIGFAREWRPDAIVHLATSIPQRIGPRDVEGQFEATNRLRTEGTRNLLDAATAAGTRRFVAQSIAF